MSYIEIEGQKIPLEHLARVLIDQNKKLERQVKQLQETNDRLRKRLPKPPNVVKQMREYASVRAEVRVALTPTADPQVISNTVYRVMQQLTALEGAAHVDVTMHADESHRVSDEALQEMANRFRGSAHIPVNESTPLPVKPVRQYTDEDLREMGRPFADRAEKRGR